MMLQNMVYQRKIFIFDVVTLMFKKNDVIFKKNTFKLMFVLFC